MPRSFIFTIGHSTRPIEEFIHLLKSHGIQRVVDVRTVPRSRFNPQYDVASLPASLEEAHIHYLHLAGLGGLRRPRPDSVNAGWRNRSFRGYADHMQTAEFTSSLERCIELAGAERVVLMRHALRNAAVPIVTVIGIGIALLIGGVVVTESVYNIPGLGRLVVDAVLGRDYPTIQAVILVFSFAYVLINLLIDLAYTLLDPRIRY